MFALVFLFFVALGMGIATSTLLTGALFPVIAAVVLVIWAARSASRQDDLLPQAH